MSIRVLIVATSFTAAACSGSKSTAPASSAAVTYEGVFATGTEGGKVTLVTGSPATGSLKITGGSSVSLTGTYTAATSAFALSGGGYAVNATVSSGAEVTGTVTSASAPVGGTMSALSSTSTSQAKSYCGRFSQTNTKAGLTSETGIMSIVINTTVIKGVAVQQTGPGAGPQSIILAGTFVQGIVKFSWGNGYGNASGVLNPNPIGTFSNADNISGVWYADPC